ncbi:MAG: hypothetical protein HOU81_00095 [Hamadaea sp.]|uniref:hypothetical protein n=1 Tax=Hamadaea sp. TaxID=2024425 RepID=UPI0018463E7D|nr:hypothetical protein [Hamadaea sp.]NUR69217.1 hypothetical protein [Hamadaea sp.]NUT22307.1 hypothetical protein [Hamadaea sp.]
MTRAYDVVVAAVARDDASSADQLAALGQIAVARKDLDSLERGLIANLRTSGVSWTQIAATIGVGSRQAAEQRYLRLCGSLDRQRTVDTAAIASLRASALRAYTSLVASPPDDPRARLAVATLEHALSASPGALYALVEQALGDLREVDFDSSPLALALSTASARSAASAGGPK